MVSVDVKPHVSFLRRKENTASTANCHRCDDMGNGEWHLTDGGRGRPEEGGGGMNSGIMYDLYSYMFL